MRILGQILLAFFALVAGATWCWASESGYIFGNKHHTIVPKSQQFVQTLSEEVFQKTGVRIYLDIIDDISIPSAYPTKQARQAYQQERAQSLQTPYVVIFLFLQEHKMDLISSQDLHSFLDQKKLDSIYFDFMAALLPEKDRDLTPPRISAVILNGYSEIADTIADHYNVKLVNNFSTDERNVKTFTDIIMIIMIVTLVGLFLLANFAGRKRSK